MKLIQQVKISHSLLQPVSNLFHFVILSLTYTALYMAVKEFFEPTSKNGEIGRLESFFTNLENQLQCTTEFVSKALRGSFFVSVVFITAENMSCVHVKQ